MLGLNFTLHTPKPDLRSNFEKLKDLFLELLLHTSGDVDEAFEWMQMLDQQHGLFTDDYTLEDFKKDLFKEKYLTPNKGGNAMSAKAEREIRSKSLEDIFGKLKRSGMGNHRTSFIGSGDESIPENRKYEFGDKLEQIDFSQSIQNAQRRDASHFSLQEEDLTVNESAHRAQMATVVMIDISHSMILYGEDRITPAKKVALALAEYIGRMYPKDSLDIVVFGNDAWTVSLKELPYLQVGPFHTNTVAGLELAMDILRKKKTSNRQIFMITDGKPSCIKLPSGEFYKNSNGLDDMIVSKCLNKAAQARKLKIPITTFMIAQDPYLRQFVELFTAQNQGKAFLTGLSGLGEMIFEDYEKNRTKRI